MADVAARYARLRYPNRPVEFCTGTDEHGMKIQKAAQDNGQEPREFCDRISQRFRVRRPSCLSLFERSGSLFNFHLGSC